MVELEGEPAVEAWIRSRAEGSRSALAASAASTRVAELRVAQARVEELLSAPAIGARVQYRVARAFNGIAVFAEPSRVEAIRALPGVKSVRPLVLHAPANSTSVPHLGVPPAVWQALGNAGDDVKVGIIDSGLDYQHAMFGGTGREADYRANDRTKVNDGFFPTARVVGGWDFAGDDYGGGGAATPDPDPMDCGGHGTHVAGSVGGSGVLADGSAFTGPYDGSVPVPADNGGYFDQAVHDSAPNFRRHAIDALEQMGISVEFSHHEGAPGQQEIDLRYADALSMADNVMTFRYLVKEVALSDGVRASFMPKPFSEHP